MAGSKRGSAKESKAQAAKTEPAESPSLLPTQLTGYKHAYTKVQEGGILFLEVMTLGGPRDFLSIPVEYVPAFIQELRQAHRFFSGQE